MASRDECRDKRRIHFKMIRYIFEAGTKLQMSSVALATAATLYHRFFKEYEIEDFDLSAIATTSIYLSGKIEEEHLRLRDVVNVSHRILNPDKPPLDVDKMYWSLRESIIQTELFFLRALQFKVSVEHPHKYLMHYLKSLYDWLDRATTVKVPIATTAWALLRDSYHGDLCLQHKPDLIAVSVLYLTLNLYGIRVPHDSEAEYHWWEALVDGIKLKEIKKVATKIMDLYDLETTV